MTFVGKKTIFIQSTVGLRRIIKDFDYFGNVEVLTVVTNDGRVWRLYENGVSEGEPLDQIEVSTNWEPEAPTGITLNIRPKRGE